MNKYPAMKENRTIKREPCTKQLSAPSVVNCIELLETAPGDPGRFEQGEHGLMARGWAIARKRWAGFGKSTSEQCASDVAKWALPAT